MKIYHQPPPILLIKKYSSIVPLSYFSMYPYASIPLVPYFSRLYGLNQAGQVNEDICFLPLHQITSARGCAFLWQTFSSEVEVYEHVRLGYRFGFLIGYLVPVLRNSIPPQKVLKCKIVVGIKKRLHTEDRVGLYSIYLYGRNSRTSSSRSNK